MSLKSSNYLFQKISNNFLHFSFFLYKSLFLAKINLIYLRRPCIETKKLPQLPGKRENKKVPYTRPVKREIKSKTVFIFNLNFYNL